MRLRNPVEYLHNPKRKPEEISVDEFFQNACSYKDPSLTATGGIRLWAQDDLWVAQKRDFRRATAAQQSWPVESLSEAVNAVLDRRVVPHVKPRAPLPVMSAADEQTVSEYLRLILTAAQRRVSTYDPAVRGVWSDYFRNRKAKVQVVWADPTIYYPPTTGFRIYVYEDAGAMGGVHTWPLLEDPLPYAATMEEALQMTAAALY